MKDLLHQAFGNYKTIVTVEDGVINGGMGSALLEWAMENNYKNKVIRLGIPDQFIAHGSPAKLQQECGFDAESIRKVLLDAYNKF
jgi:1-deoxy-D-xylulose-5-phosphate synthase